MYNFDEFVNRLCGVIPLKIKYKDESWEMKVLNYFVKWFNPTFMTNFTTVIGYTVYFTSRTYIKSYPRQAAQTLAHEAVHLLDTQRLGFPIFAFAYLFPQILAVFALLFPINIYFLLFLLFILPFPAPFRAYLEARAYAIDILSGRRKVDEVLFYFTNWDYYKMYPFDNQSKSLIKFWVENPDAIMKKVIEMQD
jgi:hypothetical protein